MPSNAPSSGKPSLEPQPQGEITVVGVVEEGVEHGCKLLRTASELYQLIGTASPLVASGARLRVRGRPDPTLLTTCQQGTPFQVADVQAA